MWGKLEPPGCLEVNERTREALYMTTLNFALQQRRPATLVLLLLTLTLTLCVGGNRLRFLPTLLVNECAKKCGSQDSTTQLVKPSVCGQIRGE